MKRSPRRKRVCLWVDLYRAVFGAASEESGDGVVGSTTRDGSEGASADPGDDGE